MHQLVSIQKIPASIEEVWKFFSDPQNLFAITPPSLNLKVTNETGTETYAGQTITYTVKPLFGIALKWVTEITQVEYLKTFVDEQRKGPYALWQHHHHFTLIDGGVEMKDIVHYRLPFGYLGNLAHAPIVKRKLNEIFSYRFYKVNEIFGAWPHQHRHLIIK